MKGWFVFVVVLFLVVCYIGCYCSAAPQTQAICFVSSEESVCNEQERVGEESNVNDVSREPLETFSGEGTFCCSFTGETLDAEEEMAALGIQNREELISFVTSTPLSPLCKPLSAKEFSRLLYLLVSEFDPNVPIQGRLLRVTFVKETDLLLLYAEAEVYLSRFAKAYHVGVLPSAVGFSALVPINVKNAEISVDYNNLYLQCDNKTIPELLLRYACNALFGVKDYKRYFGEVVGNIVANACFSG